MHLVEDRFRARSITGALAISAALAAGCAPSIRVHTAMAPDANLAGAHTYRMLRRTERARAVGANPAQSADPALNSPIVTEGLRRDIEQQLEARGYARQPNNADLSIAYYGAVRRELEVTNYDYGYPFWGWRWKWGPEWGPGPERQVTSFEQGTIVVDILDGSGQRLLWRGVGHTDVPREERDYPAVVAKTVRAIMAKFPGRAA